MFRLFRYSKLNIDYPPSPTTQIAPSIVWEAALIDLVVIIAGVSTVD